MQHNSASFQATFFKFGEGQVQSMCLKFAKFQISWSRMSDFVYVFIKLHFENHSTIVLKCNTKQSHESISSSKVSFERS